LKNILTDKIILITGGTSRLGQCFIRQALHEGAKVYFTYKSSKAMAESLEREGAKGFYLDLSRSGEIEKFAREFGNQIDQLDVLIHNAALVRDGLIADMEENDWDEVMAVNLKAPYLLTQGLMLPLFKAGGAKVLMITSRAAYAGSYGASNYAASKGGIISLTKTLAQELGKKKVLVNAVNPGFMMSAMTEKMPEKAIRKNLESSPLRKFSEPEDVAEFLIYLSSDKMRQVTGQVFHYDARRMPFF